MKKLLFFVLAVSCFAVSTATAQIDIFFSTSSTDSAAGSVLELNDGASGSLYVWVDNNDPTGGDIIGLDLDITGAGPSAITANSFLVENPLSFVPVFSTRWTSPAPTSGPAGVLGVSPGLLVDEANAISLFGSDASIGIQNGSGPVLHAELNMTATGIGVNPLTMSLGDFGLGLVPTAPPTVNFTGGTVVVVPEPASLGLVGSIVGAAFLRRRRRS